MYGKCTRSNEASTGEQRKKIRHAMKGFAIAVRTGRHFDRVRNGRHFDRVRIVGSYVHDRPSRCTLTLEKDRYNRWQIPHIINGCETAAMVELLLG